MLLVDNNKRPEMTVYYLSAVLFNLIKEENINYSELSFKFEKNSSDSDEYTDENLTLALDFLFLLDMITIDNEGIISVYSHPTHF